MLASLEVCLLRRQNNVDVDCWQTCGGVAVGGVGGGLPQLQPAAKASQA